MYRTPGNLNCCLQILTTKTKKVAKDMSQVSVANGHPAELAPSDQLTTNIHKPEEATRNNAEPTTVDPADPPAQPRPRPKKKKGSQLCSTTCLSLAPVYSSLTDIPPITPSFSSTLMLHLHLAPSLSAQFPSVQSLQWLLQPRDSERTHHGPGLYSRALGDGLLWQRNAESQ